MIIFFLDEKQKKKDKKNSKSSPNGVQNTKSKSTSKSKKKPSGFVSKGMYIYSCYIIQCILFIAFNTILFV